MVLPARRPRLRRATRGAGHADPAVGAQARARPTPPVDLTGATSGLPPDAGRVLREALTGSRGTEGQTINLAIGQGALQVSPLQLAVAYSALVNGGTVVRPHVGEAVIRNGVRQPLHFKPVRKLKLSAVHVGDQAGPLRGGERPRRHVVRRSSPGSRSRSRARRAPRRRRRSRRPLVVRVVGARTTTRSSSSSRSSSTAASAPRRRRRSRRRSTRRTSI